MKVLIAQSNNPAFNDNLTSIAKALNFLEIPVAIWDIKSVPAFDVFEQFKPTLVIADKEINNRAYLKCLSEYSPRVISSHTVPLSADIFTYGKFNLAARELTSDYTALVSYSDKEYNLIPDVKGSIKVFSNITRRISSYCGPIIPEMKPLIINSCRTFIATNTLDALNAAILNKNIINAINLDPKLLKRDYVINNRTSFHAIQFLNKKVDISKMKELV